MKTIILVASAAVSFAALTPYAQADPLRVAHVTQVVRDVKLLPADAAARPASTNDEVKHGTAVRTGADSRAELTFTDLTLTRLGANTVFSFDEGTRDIKLGSGAVLVEVPRNAPAAKITTAAVTAAITGGTALFEYHNAGPVKLIILEGNGRLCLRPDQRYARNQGKSNRDSEENCHTIGGGEMITMTRDRNGNWQFSENKIDALKVVKSSKLIQGFAPLANLDLIMNVSEVQQTSAVTTSTNNPTDLISQRAATDVPEAVFVCPFPKSGGGR